VAARAASDSEREDLASALLESDRRYFEADAEVVGLDGGSIAVLRGAESLAAGCVVQRIDASRAAADPDRWLDELETRLRTLGATRARLYLERSEDALETALARRGYRSRVEHGFVRDAVACATELALVASDDEPGWERRKEVVRRAGTSPDGFAVDPDLWIDMERRRCRAGYMRPYLVRRGGDMLGAVCAATAGPLLRIKNVIVDPAHRRQGVATAIALRFAGLAAEEGFAAAGCFAIDDAGEIYSRAGYRIETSQVEWTRDLTSAP
jgi:ribosomal protein S18 acetylase RimI-like enzyme